MRYDTELIVNLDSLAYNYSLLKEVSPNTTTLFMVKANAYGHGLLEVVSFAARELGMKRFGCASLEEAVFIRQHLPGLTCELWVFNETNLSVYEQRDKYLNLHISPVIHNLEDLEIILKDSSFNNVPLILKFDTGLHRLGIERTELEKLSSMLKRYGRVEIFHAMTHFSNSYSKFKPGGRTDKQLKTFEGIISDLEAAGVSIKERSCANSGAIEQGVGTSFEMIRPGLMLYGPASFDWKGKCISKLRTKVLKISKVKRGTPIGYGGHVCPYDGEMVILPIGYGDGILTSYSGLKRTFFGKEGVILGRVSMDLTSILFKELPRELKKGSDFYFWGENHCDIAQLAAQSKTIPYQIFTAITSRVPRRYII